MSTPLAKTNPIIETFKKLVWGPWSWKPSWLELKPANDPKASMIVTDWGMKSGRGKPRHLKVRILQPSQSREITSFKRQGYIVFLAISDRSISETQGKFLDIIRGCRN
jgi:uncharacterized protein (DUF1684 family)